MVAKNTGSTKSKASKAQQAKAAELFGKAALETHAAEGEASPQAKIEHPEPEVVEGEASEVPEAEVTAASLSKNSGMANFVAQQLTTPVALTAERQKAFDVRMQELSKEFGVAVKPIEAKIVRPKVQQHGITRPAPDTKCGFIFAQADAITAKTGQAATIAAVKAACHGINDHTVKTQYARWRAYNGIVGRLVAPAEAPKEPVKLDFSSNP